MRMRGHHERLLCSHNRERDVSMASCMTRAALWGCLYLPSRRNLLISFSQSCRRAHHVNYLCHLMYERECHIFPLEFSIVITGFQELRGQLENKKEG